MQTFLNVPGHKRASAIAIASAAAVTIAPRMTKAASLRIGPTQTPAPKPVRCAVPDEEKEEETDTTIVGRTRVNKTMSTPHRNMEGEGTSTMKEEDEDEDDDEEELSGKTAAKCAKVGNVTLSFLCIFLHIVSSIVSKGLLLAVSSILRQRSAIKTKMRRRKGSDNAPTDRFIEPDVEDDTSRRHHSMLTARTLHEQDRSPEQIGSS
ncbi:hypothetical protein JOM56_001678 [Amanita muscaria]